MFFMFLLLWRAGFLLGWGGGGGAGGAFDTINGNLCLCKNSPRFHQIASNKKVQNQNLTGEHAPGPP